MKKHPIYALFLFVAIFFQGGIAAAAPENNVQDAVLLKQAFQALEENRVKDGLDRLADLQNHTAEKLAVRLFAAFILNSWEEVIQLYTQLPEPYHSLEGYQGLVILSHIYLNKIPEAETLLNKLLHSKPDAKTQDFPDYFRDFKEKVLNNFNRYYIAALFNKIVKKDLSQSLSFLNQIKNPSAEMQMEIADIYVRQKKYVEAVRLLTSLRMRQASSAIEKRVQSQVLSQLGKISVQLGDYIAAVKYFREYFLLYPKNIDQRLFFANALMEIQRFDLAVEQFELYAAQIALTPANKIDYIESLVGAGNLEKAAQIGTDWIEKENISLLSQIRLARLLFIAQKYKLVDKILAFVAAQGKRSLEENQALISLYMDLGHFEEAASLIALLKRNLEENVSGLLLLAEFYTRISDPRIGYNYVLHANQMEPLDPKMLKALEEYEQSPSLVARNVKNLEGILQYDEENTRLQIQYAKDLILLGIESYSSNQVKSLTLSPDFQKARELVKDLLRKNSDIPEIYFLQGKIAYLIDDNAIALEAVQKATQLCPSYTEAYQYLALIQQDGHHLDDAVAALKSAVKFEPWNAKAWLQLGNLLVSADRSFEAIQAFDTARKYAPYSPEPIVDLAALYLRLNQITESVELLKTVLELDPQQIPAVKLMLKALYNKSYERSVKDLEELKKMRLLYFDKLEALDKKEAETLRQQLSATQ